ncbi:DUF2192 domain-containing protein [Thermofilum sp.]|uniref:DUF2192 domain-containing protein n=1 Tax=Thermofilum sp. TaxID=1961369 RepID=UPI00258710E5|nr:DUF2192 domain-containing protein [Thermofilum sp.]
MERTRQALRKRVNIAVEAAGKILAGEITTREDLRRFLLESHIEAGIEPFLGTRLSKLYYSEAMVYVVAHHGLGLQEELDIFNDLFKREKQFNDIITRYFENHDVTTILEFSLSQPQGNLKKFLSYFIVLWLLGFLEEKELMLILHELSKNKRITHTARGFMSLVVAFKLAERLSSGQIQRKREKEIHKNQIAIELGDERSLPKDSLVWRIAVNILEISESIANKALRLKPEELEAIALESPTWWYSFIISLNQLEQKLSELSSDHLREYSILEEMLRDHISTLSSLVAFVLLSQYVHAGKSPKDLQDILYRMGNTGLPNLILDQEFSGWKIIYKRIAPFPMFEIRVESTNELIVVDVVSTREARLLGIDGLRKRIYTKLSENPDVRLRTGGIFLDEWLRLVSTILAIKIAGESMGLNQPSSQAYVLKEINIDNWNIELRMIKNKKIAVYINHRPIGASLIYPNSEKTLRKVKNIIKNSAPKEIKEKYLDTILQQVSDVIKTKFTSNQISIASSREKW